MMQAVVKTKNSRIDSCQLRTSGQCQVFHLIKVHKITFSQSAHQVLAEIKADQLGQNDVGHGGAGDDGELCGHQLQTGQLI